MWLDSYMWLLDVVGVYGVQSISDVGPVVFSCRIAPHAIAQFERDLSLSLFYYYFEYATLYTTLRF